MITQLRPGLPGYTGPKSGIFAVIHHDIMFEYSHDVFERLDFIDSKKPQHQRKIRRESILYLGECPALAECKKAVAEYDKATAKREKGWAKRHRARAEYEKAVAEYDKATAKREKGWAKRHRARAEYEKAEAEYKKALDEFNKALDEFYKALDELKKAGATVEDAAVLSYIHQHIPDFPWDGRQLVFPKAAV